MSLFHRRASTPKIPFWRDANGAIVCKGDNCDLSKCSDECPIWLNTQALSLARINQKEKAIEIYEQALRIAPDFVDAWNNVAALYGLSGEFEKARQAYQKAYEMGHRANALYGLALANRDCGNAAEAIRCCEEYRTKFTDGRLDEVYADLKKTRTAPNALDFAKVFINGARRANKLTIEENTFPNIPEIVVFAKTTGQTFFVAMRRQCSDNTANWKKIALVWCGYAGIGAVHLWDKDWPLLKAKGVYSLLTEPRGLEEMDEYVSDEALNGFDSNESNIAKIVLLSCAEAGLKLIQHYVDAGCDEQETIYSCCEGMFLFGMVYMMDKMGMK